MINNKLRQCRTSSQTVQIHISKSQAKVGIQWSYSQSVAVDIVASSTATFYTTLARQQALLTNSSALKLARMDEQCQFKPREKFRLACSMKKGWTVLLYSTESSYWKFTKIFSIAVINTWQATSGASAVKASLWKSMKITSISFKNNIEH